MLPEETDGVRSARWPGKQLHSRRPILRSDDAAERQEALGSNPLCRFLARQPGARFISSHHTSSACHLNVLSLSAPVQCQARRGSGTAWAGASAQPHQLPLLLRHCADAHPCPLTPHKALHPLEPSWKPRQRDGMFGDERASSVTQLYHPSSRTITPLLAP